MICKRFVPEERQKASRKNYTNFVLVNGFAYSCLGDTVIILLAVQLKSPDWIISILGAMVYFGYLLLPLGRIVTSWTGAAKSQSYFWVARNLAALLVAASVPVCLYVGRIPSMILMVMGSFFFYGFRAAGYVLSGPLIGDITTEENRASYIASNSSAGYSLGVAALIVINILVYLTNNNLWTLTGVVLAGACLGIHASGYLRKVDETRTLRDSARKPLLPQLGELMREKGIKRLLLCTFCTNMSVIMLVPISLLTLKRGYHITDTGAVAFSITQWIASAVTPFFSGRIARHYGPRKLVIFSYCTIFMVGILWILYPFFFKQSPVPPYLLLLPFIIGGGCVVAMNNGLTHYYLESIRKDLLVTYAILSSTIGGVCAGVIGMAVTGGILAWLETHTAGGVSRESYATYFMLVLPVLLAGLIPLLTLTPLSAEQRQRHQPSAELK